MDLLLILLTLNYFTGPIDSVEYSNVGSVINISTNEITLNAELTFNNTYVSTSDTFYTSVDINTSDYLIDLVEVDKIVQKTEFGIYRLQGDNLTFNISYSLTFYDLNGDLLGNINANDNNTFVMAEAYGSTFPNQNSYISTENTIYDYSSSYSSGYDDGYDEGYDEGLEQGYDEGYYEGLEQGRTEGQGVNNVISWFGSVWDGLARILSLEIAPNLTIGIIITIPIVIAVLFFGLKALIQ